MELSEVRDDLLCPGLTYILSSYAAPAPSRDAPGRVGQMVGRWPCTAEHRPRPGHGRPEGEQLLGLAHSWLPGAKKCAWHMIGPQKRHAEATEDNQQSAGSVFSK